MGVFSKGAGGCAVAALAGLLAGCGPSGTAQTEEAPAVQAAEARVVPPSHLVLDLPGEGEKFDVAYKCSNGQPPFTVTYINAGPNSLAIVPSADGVPVVFVNVISASGAKYAAGSQIWWTKGASAFLADEMGGEEPLFHCEETEAEAE